MTTDQYTEIYEVLSSSKLTKAQWNGLTKLLKEKKSEAVVCRGAKGVHITRTESDELDADIILGLSQKDICTKYNISPTTFKRHRKKLIEQGHSIEVYEKKLKLKIESEKRRQQEEKEKLEAEELRQAEEDLFRYLPWASLSTGEIPYIPPDVYKKWCK